MKTIVRYIIALIFIASGFVKAVDVIGFSFKLEEYFSPSVFNMPFLEKYALFIAIAVVSLEILLGVMLFLKLRLKNTLIALISLCIFFAFLTFYSAFYNVVTDCGCFGDALKFTPWQSFWKDIFLLVGLFILYLLNKKTNFGKNETGGCIKSPMLWLSTLITIFIIYWGITHEPLIDFRDYKIGTNLKNERAKALKNPSEYKAFYSMKNSKTNEVLLVNQDDYVNDKKYWEEGSPWKIEEGKNTSKLTKQGYETEVNKLKIEDNSGMELTEEILNAPKAVLVFSYDPNHTDVKVMNEIENKLLNIKDAYKLGVSTHPETFKKLKNTMMDGTAIKTIARSNPFVLILENGIIVEKKSAKDYIK